MRLRPPDWMRQAACVGEDPDTWFDASREDDAKAICQHCPVKPECWRYARLEGIDWGIWGGQTAAERCGRGRPSFAAVTHGTYNGYRQHRYREEEPCEPCKTAQKGYDAWRRQKALQRNGPGARVEN